MLLRIFHVGGYALQLRTGSYAVCILYHTLSEVDI